MRYRGGDGRPFELFWLWIAEYINYSFLKYPCIKLVFRSLSACLSSLSLSLTLCHSLSVSLSLYTTIYLFLLLILLHNLHELGALHLHVHHNSPGMIWNDSVQSQHKNMFVHFKHFETYISDDHKFSSCAPLMRFNQIRLRGIWHCAFFLSIWLNPSWAHILTEQYVPQNKNLTLKKFSYIFHYLFSNFNFIYLLEHQSVGSKVKS